LAAVLGDGEAVSECWFFVESVMPGPPDLVVVSLQTMGPATVNPEGQIEVPIRVVVRNQGGAAADIFKVSTEYSDAEGTWAVPFTVPGQDYTWYPYTSAPLPAGAKTTFQGVVTFSYAQDETVSLRAIADSCAGDEFVPDHCRVEESNEANNESTSIAVSLPAAALYDLYVRRMDFSPANPVVGQTIQLFIMIATDTYPSQGPFFPASHFRWRQGSGFPWQEESCPADANYAACTKTVEFSYSQPGSYYVQVEADSRNETTETDENNNAGGWTIEVTQQTVY
jgi:hypothetical protein